MNFLFLILAFLAFPAFGFADQNDLNKWNVGNFFIPAALGSIGGLAAVFYLTFFKPDFISLKHGTSEDDFKNAGCAISLPSPIPSVSSAPLPIVSHANAKLFWYRIAIFAAVLSFYCIVIFLIRKVPCCKTIENRYQPPETKESNKTNKHSQAAVALLKEQLNLKQEQIELLRRELTTAIDKNDVLTQENRRLVALIKNTNRPQLQAPIESLTSIHEIGNSDKSNSNKSNSNSDSDAELYHDGSMNCISVTNGGNTLGRVTLDNNSELSIASGSRTLARLNRAVSNSRIRRKASKIFDLSTHGGRRRK
ncbi:hypothetical protein COEREDRAFT_95121 [Coemansia reversa NRRL 1564]|uniref:Uncharacterized protein n=1 Tax=Coemansia reversa (strain ATCC 12441 / NRRL 1564) TaxID=763665 RepID=A0A2G5BKQ6_COERN|nr:hypothetical protein COEREDRAFT_95121 [Coemansia reversa NRRL 1564]|eukprot:PIA19589.1 hypothetical protein COEREDRAFT_95121 [Coemansia reversa NRRL 1564]